MFAVGGMPATKAQDPQDLGTHLSLRSCEIATYTLHQNAHK